MGDSRVPLLSAEQATDVGSSLGFFDLKSQLSIYRILLHQPEVAQRISDLMATLTNGTEIEARLRETIVMRIGWLRGGVYEWTQHWQLAPLFGVDQDDLLAVRDWEHDTRWSPAERAALRATDEIVTSGVMTDDTWAGCVEHFRSVRAQLELVMTIEAWTMLSGVAQCLHVPLEDGVDPWPPDGSAPSPHGGVS